MYIISHSVISKHSNNQINSEECSNYLLSDLFFEQGNDTPMMSHFHQSFIRSEAN